MENLTTQIWQILIIASAISLILGVIIGYVLFRFSRTVKKQLKTETELKQMKTKLEEQNHQLEKHFSESTELLKNIAQDYQKLYHHLSDSSVKLLPETKSNLFDHNLIKNQENQSIDPTECNQPKDYSEGSSGILKNFSKIFNKK